MATGDRVNTVASLDQSLKRMGLEYVDIFYHHRPDPETPLQETMRALDHLVRGARPCMSDFPTIRLSRLPKRYASSMTSGHRV